MKSQVTGTVAALTLLSVASALSPCTPGTWQNLTSVPSARQEHGTTAIGNETIAILGGNIRNNVSSETTDLFQLYDIESDTWKTVAPAPYKVNHPNIAAIGGKLYLLGGLAVGPVASAADINWVATGLSYVYDVAGDEWTQLEDMPVGTERGSAVVGVHGEMIYLAGGMTVLKNRVQDAVNSVIAFNTTSGEYQRLGVGGAELPESRQHAAGAVINDTFYVIGGRRYSQTNYRDTVFQLDLSSPQAIWQINSARMRTARGGINGGAVGNVFYVFGGEGNPDSDSGVFPQIDAFDTGNSTWTRPGPMSIPRHGTQAASAGGRIYIPGGGLQQDGKAVTNNGVTTIQNQSAFFNAYCA